MKIAQVAPLIESVPPRLYGGTERIVSYLTEELVKLGHDVTLFASGDSITSAELVPCCHRALRLDRTVSDATPHFMMMVDKVRERAEEFDILHFHTDLLHFPLFRSLAARTVDHAARSAGSGRPKILLFPFRRNAIGFHLRRPAQTIAESQFCSDHPTRPSAPSCTGRRLRREAILPFSGGFRRKSGRTAR